MPKAIRDELRLTCALRGFASMRQGFHNTLAEQAKIMYDFFHGVPGKQPSQLKMLAEGTGVYRDLYKATMQRIVTSKKKRSNKSSDDGPVTRLRLDSKLTRTDGVYYYTDGDISHSDLQKKNRLRGNELSGGRSITTLARNGACSYRKACAYASDKWDMKKNEPKESGTTVDDVIK